MKSTKNGGEQALHGLAPKLATSASVRRRETNNPSLESLSSCRHEELAIDGVRAPRATQAVFEPGAFSNTLKVPTAAPYSSMQAWIGVMRGRREPTLKPLLPPKLNNIEPKRTRSQRSVTHSFKLSGDPCPCRCAPEIRSSGPSPMGW